MSRWLSAAMLAVGIAAAAAAQQTAAVPPPNDAVVQYYRAVMSAGGTQAVLQAVTQAVLEALKQGPMTPEAAQQALAGGAVAANVTAAASAPAPAILPKTWADYVTLKGDIRYRVETITDDSKPDKNKNNTPYTRQRDRIRARLGADVKVNDNIKAVLRLTTDEAATVGGGGDPISGNQTLGGGSSKKGVYLDAAYFDWNFFGEGTSELHGLAGKMDNPFLTMNDDLVWDPDVTPEGVALKGTLDLAPVTLLGNLGCFWIAERDAKDPLTLLAGQGAARIEFMPEIALTLGASLYSFQNVAGNDVIDYKYDGTYERAVNLPLGKTNYPSGYGNSVKKSFNPAKDAAPRAVYACGYNVAEPFARLDVWPTVFGRVVPVSAFGQYIQNLQITDNNQGYMYGLSIGKAKNPGTFEVGASYARIEKDATLGLWTDSDRWGGGTDGEGYKLYAKYQILKGLQAGLTYFADEKPTSSGPTHGYNRMQADLVASF